MTKSKDINQFQNENPNYNEYVHNENFLPDEQVNGNAQAIPKQTKKQKNLKPIFIPPNALYKNVLGFEESMRQMNILCRYNTRMSRLELKWDSDCWAPSTDQLLNTIRTYVEKRFVNMRSYPLKFSISDTRTYFDGMTWNHKYDPFSEWLESLPEWDEKLRIDKMLSTLFIDPKREILGSDDTELVSWASRYPFIGSIQRTDQPGCALREIPILIGKQNIGKSSLLRNLFPQKFQADWFSDDLSFRTDSKGRIESTQGKVLIEWNELEGISKSAFSTLKSFISSTSDTLRLAYRRDAETIKRRFVIVGTTNEYETLPNDPSGNSRYVPIRLDHGSSVEQYMKDNREQLWAEALFRYSEGERANLPRKFAALQAKLNEEHRDSDDMLEDLIRERIQDNRQYTQEEISIEIGFIDSNAPSAFSRLGNQQQTRLNKALRNCGFVKKKDSTGKRFWIKNSQILVTAPEQQAERQTNGKHNPL